MNHYKNALKKYFDFKTRATRAEYWYFFLFFMLGLIVFAFIDIYIGSIIGKDENETFIFFTMIFLLSHLIPGYAVLFRRMHDIGKSAWWILLGIIPYIGSFIIFYFALKKSQPGTNKYGPNPKETNGSNGISDSVTSTPASSTAQTDAMPIEHNFNRPVDPTNNLS